MNSPASSDNPGVRRCIDVTRSLVIGYGSIGARHARVLQALGCEVAVLSQRQIGYPLAFTQLEQALGAHAPSYVVIANATDQHYATVQTLAASGFKGTVLVEKPLFHQLRELPVHSFAHAAVAYNLRFHPVIAALRQALLGESILSVQAYAGQYLPQWRPDSDYRTGYSADAARGGGVLRDLSHELDYLSWLLGASRKVAALGGHVSPLEISSDDAFALLFATDRCPMVSVQLNYLDRAAKRRIVVNTARHTLDADLIGGTFAVDGMVRHFAVDRDTSYVAMHQALLAGKLDTACTLDEGLMTLRMISAATHAAAHMEWTEL